MKASETLRFSTASLVVPPVYAQAKWSFIWLARFERRLIQARVQAGLEAAWAAGSVSGRMPLDRAENVEKLETRFQAEGWPRDFVRLVQNARKDVGLAEA